MNEPHEISSNKLSMFRTKHRFASYCQFESIEEYKRCLEIAAEEGRKVYILGNGSNTLFRNHDVKSMVLKNAIPKQFEFDPASPEKVRVGSSTPLSVLIKHCERHKLQSFYYLASVPATVGGALAMNAGRGPIHNQTIFDFIESVSYFDGDQTIVGSSNDLVLGHRQTIFTGVHARLILHADFEFPPQTNSESDEYVFNKIEERIRWSKEIQDNSSPNCGSVFRVCHPLIMRPVKGLSLGTAKFSKKTGNWMLSSGESSKPIVRLIKIVKYLHLLILRRAKVEIIEVD